MVVVFIMLVAFMALLPYLGKNREKSAYTPVTNADSTSIVSILGEDHDQTDSIPAIPETKKPVPPKKAADKKEAVDPSVIDELFRQATELFE